MNRGRAATNGYLAAGASSLALNCRFALGVGNKLRRHSGARNAPESIGRQRKWMNGFRARASARPGMTSERALGSVDSKDSLLGANQIQSCFWEAALGVMDRLVLSDATWERMAPLIIGRPDQKGSTGRDNRMFVEGVLWIVRTGSPWRDLPEAFGDWNSVFRRFSRWSLKGVWWRIFEAMSDDPDFEYLIVDSTIVRAHQHAAGAKKGGLKIRRLAVRAAA